MRKIPKEVLGVVKKLQENNFEAYLVGGCVRDFVLGKKPKDWDVTTNAKPEEIQEIFPDNFYENQYGTVGVKTSAKDQSLAVIEVTPYRIEAKYSDKRHPDKIEFAKELAQDLGRRDFTVNALAMDLSRSDLDIIDLVGGEEDLKNKVIRAVGDPDERFKEDALRLIRAIRFSAELGFEIEDRTRKAIWDNSGLLKFISKERIRDELNKLLMSARPSEGIELLRESGLLKEFMPELLEGYGVDQNLHHIYTVWEHNLRALAHSAKEEWPLDVRMAALLHDVGKPRTKRGEGKFSTFYGHDVVGAKMATQILSRLHYSKDFIDKVAKLIRYHLFYYNVDEVTESSVRRLIAKVGIEDMQDLIRVRIADRIGSGVPKAEPYKLRHFRFMVEKLQRDPISAGMLKVRGDDVMKICKIEPGPRVGWILAILLDEVLDDPKKNTKKHLEEKIQRLCPLPDKELALLSKKSQEKKLALESGEIEEIKKKHYVK
ncbi:HD domain-containing protein [Candidatus Giovannonibacteria bacterium]|nr:HD domain-containing protein [Candidatus Giovannonibacteria bacterium]